MVIEEDRIGCPTFDQAASHFTLKSRRRFFILDLQYPTLAFPIPSSGDPAVMVPRQLNPTTEISHSSGMGRKRVREACDRCRLKKSKVHALRMLDPCAFDLLNLLLSATAPNLAQVAKVAILICLTGERRNVPDKVHPKG